METANLVTLIGSSISLLFALSTLVYFAIYWNLNRTRVVFRRAFFLLNLSAALVVLNAILISSVSDGVIANPNGCLAVAAIVHFSITSVSMWLMADIFNLCFMTFQATSYHTNMTNERLFLPAMFRSWAVPGIFVGILAAVNKNYYLPNDQRCWLQNVNMLIFTIPSSIIIGIDALLYIGLTYMIFFNKRSDQVDKILKKQQKRQLFESFLLYLSLFGMWLFGFNIIDTLTNQNLAIAFACLFAVFIITFGLTVLVLSIIGDKSKINVKRDEIGLNQRDNINQ